MNKISKVVSENNPELCKYLKPVKDKAKKSSIIAYYLQIIECNFSARPNLIFLKKREQSLHSGHEWLLVVHLAKLMACLFPKQCLRSGRTVPESCMLMRISWTDGGRSLLVLSFPMSTKAFIPDCDHPELWCLHFPRVCPYGLDESSKFRND